VAELMITVFFQILLVLFVYSAAWFVISLIVKRNDIADIAWGLGFCLVCVYLFLTQPRQVISSVLYILVTIWGLRLSLHIYQRSRNKPEDFRYRQWREDWGKTFFWRSYLQVYLLQAFFLLVISSPIMLASVSSSIAWSWFSSIGIGVWLLGFFFQTVADYQLSVFVRQRKDKSEIMQSGLWKYSRHPNYFGEILMWWGIFIIVLPLRFGVFFIISPLTLSFLLIFVSGIPMLEKKYEGNAAFQAYKKRTPALLPKMWG
jgi:steroid 5-alpha reductase family enzyme